MDNYNYPVGSDTPEAPWNKSENNEKEIEVTVSVTLSKTVKIRVTDYSSNYIKDEDGNPYEEVDFSECDIKGAVSRQISLPQEEVEGWNVDDFEVIMEE